MQHLSRDGDAEPAGGWMQGCDASLSKVGAELERLLSHSLYQLRSGDPARKPGVISSSRDQCCATVALVDYDDGQTEPSQIDGCRQTRWPPRQ